MSAFSAVPGAMMPGAIWPGDVLQAEAPAEPAAIFTYGIPYFRWSYGTPYAG
jgi:hypothetical protein